jgi:hypothetical protein
MGAVLNRAVAANGVIAYQDHEQTSLFHYLPARIDARLRETLIEYSVSYFGINKRPYMVQKNGERDGESLVGGVLRGTAVPDITADQRDAINTAINDHFSIPNCRLVPLEVRNTTVQPVFANAYASMGTGSAATFPATVKFGSSFAYTISTGNSLFAQMVASQRAGDEVGGNSQVGANFTGFVDFYGDPWTATIRCDLSEVWKYTRTQVDAGLSLGWVNLGTDLDKISRALVNEGIVSIKYREGSGGEEFGRQLLETTKTLFEEINKQVTAGEGLFRFEPNPEPQAPPENENSLMASLLPWQAAANLSFGSDTFDQEIRFEQTVSFTGKIEVPVSCSMALALPCSPSTEQFFFDIQENKTGCITPQKSQGLQKRLTDETAAKNDEIKSLYEQLRRREITAKEYADFKAVLNDFTLTEHPTLTQEEVSGQFAEMREAMLMLTRYRRLRSGTPVSAK